MAPTGMIPPSLCAATAAKPMEATHPTRTAVRIFAELTGDDLGFQVRRQGLETDQSLRLIAAAELSEQRRR
jgi:hypothetical protein